MTREPVRYYGQPSGYDAPPPHGPPAPPVPPGYYGYGYDPYYGAPPALYPQEEEQRESLWEMLNDRLGGRWKYMIPSACAVALVLAFIGWQSGDVSYQSAGAIHFQPNLRPLLHDIDELTIDRYEQFVETQRMLMLGNRVLENALDQPDLASTEWAKQPDALLRLQENLDIEGSRSHELVYVRFNSQSPEVAKFAVDAVMTSYFEIYGTSGGDEVTQNIQSLDLMVVGKKRDFQTLNSEIHQLTAQYGNDLNSEHQLRSQELREVEAALTRAKHVRDVRKEQGVEALVDIQDVSGATLQRLETFNPSFADARSRRDRALATYRSAQQRYRPEARPYTMAKQDAESAELVYQEELRGTLRAFFSSSETVPGDMMAGFEMMSDQRLSTEIAALDTKRTSLREQVRNIIRDNQVLQDKLAQKESLEDEIAQMDRRKDDLDRESTRIAGRAKIVQTANRPLGVNADSRKKLAAFGGAFGMAAVCGVFFLVGTFDRRTYGTRQLALTPGPNVPPVLGVLPDLSKGLMDEDANDVASHCVHQIRNQIEAIRDPRDGFVLTVTSPFQGDGKTSIVLSLGWSYAAAGYRTIVVDCDMVGRSLTRQLGLVGQHGLKESITSGRVNGEVASLRVDHLSALPVGVDSRIGPETLRRRDLDRLFGELRKQYDIIVVDTGPLLGSLESTPVTAAADAVVLTVRRGRSRARLEECVSKLSAVGARCIGTILNCAGRSDCYRYVSEASLAAAEQDRGDVGEVVNPSRSLVRAAEGERNALVLAMESTSRSRGTQHEDQEQNEPVAHG